MTIVAIAAAPLSLQKDRPLKIYAGAENWTLAKFMDFQDDNRTKTPNERCLLVGHSAMG